jgi:hypothetical protein
MKGKEGLGSSCRPNRGETTIVPISRTVGEATLLVGGSDLVVADGHCARKNDSNGRAANNYRAG